MRDQGLVLAAVSGVEAPSRGTEAKKTPSVDPTVPAPSAVASRLRGALLRAATTLTAAGLFTISWDRLLNVQLASYNVKIPSLVFSVAFVLAVVAARQRLHALLGSKAHRAIGVLTAVILLYMVVRGAFAPLPAAAAAQVTAVLTGAVLPAATLLLVVRTTAQLRWALRWLLAGAVIAAAFGMYQLLAFYLGWPQGITYTGVGIGSSLGRISAFNYEPAYFAYFIVLALGAYVALRRLDGADVQWTALACFAGVLYLANVRAVPIVVLAFGLLLLLAASTHRRLLIRGAFVTAITVLVALAVPVIVGAVTAAQQAPVIEAEQQGPPPTRPDEPSSSAAATPAPRTLQSQLQKTVDPAEPSSNGPRLDLYRAVLTQVGRAPLVGVGPGQLARALRDDAPETVQDQGGGQVVANNIWLQALADGGVPLLLLELAFVVVVAFVAFGRRTAAAFPMAAAWLAVVGVGGMLTSYLFDIKVWAVLALLLVAFSTARRMPAAGEVRR